MTTKGTKTQRQSQETITSLPRRSKTRSSSSVSPHKTLKRSTIPLFSLSDMVVTVLG